MKNDEQFDELERLAQPLVAYLRNNYHPHTAMIVTDDRVAIVESVISIPFERNDN